MCYGQQLGTSSDYGIKPSAVQFMKVSVMTPRIRMYVWVKCLKGIFLFLFLFYDVIRHFVLFCFALFLNGAVPFLLMV